MNRYKIIIISILIFLNISCCGFNPCIEEEIYRESSIDNVVDAIIVKKDCGATTSASYAIYIVLKDSTPKDQEPVFFANHVTSLKLKWVKPQLLSINYKKARILNFTNFWHSKKLQNFMYEVNILLENSRDT